MIHPLIQTKLLCFIKENNEWYIDLPEVLEQSLATKEDLMMVEGADTFLDFISDKKNQVSILLSITDFPDAQYILKKDLSTEKKVLLSIDSDEVGEYGSFYDVKKVNDDTYEHRIWLCPVTLYVLDGIYPDVIYIKIKNRRIVPLNCSHNN